MQDSPQLVDDDEDVFRSKLRKQMGLVDETATRAANFNSLTPLTEERLFAHKPEVLMPWEVSSFQVIFGGVDCTPVVRG